MDLGLKGRACAVTGASRGIGRDVARRLAAEGASVLLIARGAEELEAAAADCGRHGEAAGGRAEALALDVTEPDAGERIAAAAAEAFGQLDVLVNNAGTARWRPLEDVPDADWQAAWDLNVMAPLRAMRAAIPGMRERGWGRIVNVSSTAGKRPSAMMPEYSVAKAAELSLSRLVADLYAGDGVIVNAVCPGPDEVRALDGPGRPARPVPGGGRAGLARGCARRGGRQAADRQAGGGRRGGRGDRLPVLGARVLRLGRRLVGRRRHGAGDHLSDAAFAHLRERLLDPAVAAEMDAHGRTEAAVLVPLLGAAEDPEIVFTERRHDLRRHAGEISFPGGRRDSPGEDLLATALREAHEEIGLDPGRVELVGALPPIGTFVTSYKVHPFVGAIPDASGLEPSPDEVAAVLRFRTSELRGGFAMRRLVRRGVPIRTPTYLVGDHLIWGATARILGDLLGRLEP